MIALRNSSLDVPLATAISVPCSERSAQTFNPDSMKLTAVKVVEFVSP
jgi:hypothetical protein